MEHVSSVSGAGMSVRVFSDGQLREMHPITLDELAACLAFSMRVPHGASQTTELPWVRGAPLSKHLEVVERLKNTETESTKAPCPFAGSWKNTYEFIVSIVRKLAGGTAAAALSADTPLMEAGIDSLAATELSMQLRALTGVALPATLVWVTPPRAPAVEWSFDGARITSTVTWPGAAAPEVLVRYRRA